VDALRGGIIILMALDHVRDFTGAAMAFSPTDLSRTSAALFFCFGRALLRDGERCRRFRFHIN